jgi:hypothetical protein
LILTQVHWRCGTGAAAEAIDRFPLRYRIDNASGQTAAQQLLDFRVMHRVGAVCCDAAVKYPVLLREDFLDSARRQPAEQQCALIE